MILAPGYRSGWPSISATAPAERHRPGCGSPALRRLPQNGHGRRRRQSARPVLGRPAPVGSIARSSRRTVRPIAAQIAPTLAGSASPRGHAAGLSARAWKGSPSGLPQPAGRQAVLKPAVLHGDGRDLPIAGQHGPVGGEDAAARGRQDRRPPQRLRGRLAKGGPSRQVELYGADEEIAGAGPPYGLHKPQPPLRIDYGRRRFWRAVQFRRSLDITDAAAGRTGTGRRETGSPPCRPIAIPSRPHLTDCFLGEENDVLQKGTVPRFRRHSHANIPGYRRGRLHRFAHRRGPGRRGDRVRVLDNLSTGRWRTWTASATGSSSSRATSSTPRAVAAAVEGVDCIFHEAALASVPLERRAAAGRATPPACTGTVALLDAARRAGRAAGGLRRLQQPPTAISPPAASARSDLPAPISPYAAAKLAAELYCQAFTATFGLETVALRYFNVFGPRQDPASPYSAVIPLFITAMLSGRQPVVYGDGRQSRDFGFVANVVQANLLAADAPGVAGRVFNVANGRAIDLLTLIDAAQSAAWAREIQPAARAAACRRRPREPGRHHLGANAAGLRARGRFRGGPAAVDRLLSLDRPSGDRKRRK